MEKQIKIICPEHPFLPSGTILDTYVKRYLELIDHVYSLYKHDLKNYQNAILMSVDLYSLKSEEKYLNMVSDASYKTLEHIDLMKSFEPIIYSGRHPGFYFCFDAVKSSMENENRNFEIIGEDIKVFADTSFPLTLGLLVSTMLKENEEDSIQINFEISESPEKPDFCFIDIIFKDFSIPKQISEMVQSNEENNVTGNCPSVAIYIAKMILSRYSGSLEIIEEKNNGLRIILLKEEHNAFKKGFLNDPSNKS